jgi:hypothetical protein
MAAIRLALSLCVCAVHFPQQLGTADFMRDCGSSAIFPE